MAASTEKSNAERLAKMVDEAGLGGGQSRIDDQHNKGKKTARERVALLLDEGSFVETDRLVLPRSEELGPGPKHYGDGVVTGYGTIEGRTVYLFAHDFTSLGGSLGEMFGKKVTKVMDLALKAGAPFIGLNDSGGARIQEGVQSLASYGEVFFRNTLSSGVIPQISAILGPAAGGAVYSPALTDFTIMVDKISYMFVTGPDVVKAALGEVVTSEELGGATVHATKSGDSAFTAYSEEECMALIRKLLSFLPSNCEEPPPRIKASDDPERQDEPLDSIVPEDPAKPYDMKQVVRTVLDNGDFLEVHAAWAPNIIVGFGRLDGSTVGVVANQPMHLGGALDIDSSDKAARFVRFCDCFNIPIATFVDVPGYMPGTAEESGGIIRHGSKLLFAYCEATVPKVTVVTRKAYGGGYIAMGSKHSKADLNFAWPSAEIAVMGAEGAVKIIHKRELEGASEDLQKKFTKEYSDLYINPFMAAHRGIIDAIIRPRETRPQLVRAFRSLVNKSEQRPPRHHANIPL